jgi:hypothetical protein
VHQLRHHLEHPVQYYLFHLDKALPPAARQLREHLLESAEAWKAVNRR